MNATRDSLFTAALDVQSVDLCFVCNKSLANGQWFCRLPEDFNAADKSQRKILLCSSHCTFRYFAALDIGMARI